MKTITFIAITLISGAIAGTILGAVNQVVVEPYIERAIELEMQNAAQNGEIINPIEFAAYRFWQRGGEVAAGTILGLSLGSLFGIVFAYGRGSVPGSSNKKKALVIAGIMWFTLFLIPALKYPANPPAVGDPDTILYRQGLYLAFLAISGFSALGLAFLYRRLGATMKAKKALIPAIYAVIMAGTYFAMPPNPDPISAPMDLVISFRIASAFTISMFWGLLGITLGAFWDKLRPHETARISMR
ncbi:putative cobalt transporter family protein, subunit CbtA [Candidatus Nitrososphaera gargensis Ga9.2]|uniref:Putative cobalt transporter family protein, subunit CbtA n=1 Tax=Nitrososphaera gargensis (strain Ga9.2) TaxID=1237085 RepID=K0IJ41_NITGG|nr:CbtA family protein [Candidatus Nitrososphaera gargensis]AFU58167.1 putative cobalt transporter family protein, subunit CbtA [Candidatus Nitrososphaera gargensis Ga9.2]